jgi:hypothetical protein
MRIRMSRNSRVAIVLLSGFAITLVVFLAFSFTTSPQQPKQQNPKITTISYPLSFTVFTFAEDKESINIIRKHYSSNNSYIMQSIRSILPFESSPLFEEFPGKNKMIIVQSLDNMTEAMQ